MTGVSFYVQSATPDELQNFITGLLGLALSPLKQQLDRIEANQHAEETQETRDMSAISTQLADLQAKLKANTDTVGSIETFVVSVPKLISDAVAAAIEAGATPEEVQALTDLATGLQNNTDGMIAALAAGTPIQPAVTSMLASRSKQRSA